MSEATPDHEMFWQTANLLPVGAFELTKYPTVTIDADDMYEVLADVGRIRVMEEGVGHWMGLMPYPGPGTGQPAGIAYLPFGPDSTLYRGKTSASIPERGDDRARTRSQPQPQPCGLRRTGGRGSILSI